MDVKQSETASSSANRNDQDSQQQGAAQRDTKNVATQQGQTQGGQESRVARRGTYPFVGPFAMLQRLFTDDMLGILEQPGRLARQKTGAGGADEVMTFAPKVDVVQRGNELVVRADLPGLTQDDVTVEVTDDSIIISGRRTQERVDDSGGVYRLERTYGEFFREIPLPEGAIGDQAKASFKDGVLEITVPAPPEQVSRGRRLEIAR